ncbi:unnamed protein product [Cuscuta europaea]|uniref:Uncharacterized protein n=1 Tax=Cuscuta europaea TaxID=41803 RepID=A0A9P0ZR00_CUSEU|nr:unnamed protein product [Cuscuta europaea]
MDNRDMDNQPSFRSNKVLILAGVCLLFVFVGIFSNHNNHKTTKVENETTKVEIEMIWKTIKSFHTHNFINYVSKRVVPSTPNERHNGYYHIPETPQK